MSCLHSLLTIVLGLCCFLPSVALAEKISVGTWKTAQTIQPFFYADFLPDELKVQVHSFTNPADQKTALLAGSLDMTGTTIAHAIHSAAQGQPVVIITALCNKSSALVVGVDSDIHSETDLAGKTIGYVPGTMHEMLLRETLERNSLSPETDVTLIRIDFFDMGTALARGSIDAFLSGEPFPALAVQQGFGRILAYPYFDDSVGTINAAMIVRREMIEENPQIVAQLVLTHARVTEHLNQNQDDWLEAATRFGIPLEILKQSAGNMELSWDIDDDYIRQVRALGARMEKLGLISTQPDYAKLFDLQFVRQAKERLQ